jgi:hypothetical protein
MVCKLLIDCANQIRTNKPPIFSFMNDTERLVVLLYLYYRESVTVRELDQSPAFRLTSSS